MAFGRSEGNGGLLDKIFKLNNFDEDEDYEEDDDYIFDEEDDDDDYDEPIRAPRKKSKPEPKTSRGGFGGNTQSSQAGASGAGQNKRYTSVSRTATDNLVSFNNRDNKAGKSAKKYSDSVSDNYSENNRKEKMQSTRTAAGGSQDVFVIKPQGFDDAQTVADFLKSGKVIVINMEGLQLETAQRIIDFIGGACYGIDGQLNAVSASIFIAAPVNIEVTGDLRVEILNSASVSPLLGN